MSTADEEGGGLRSVSSANGMQVNDQMDAIGWLVFLGIVFVMLPVVPVVVLIWVVAKLSGRA